MAQRALILVGDSTSHGGVVLECADTNTLDGRAIAYVGHGVSCPKCKGDFPILPDGSGGHVLPWIGGLNVAVEGMQTACGATLIASQLASGLRALGKDLQGVVWLISERDPPGLAQALRERLNVRLRGIGVALLRFYDPTLLQGILALLSPSQRASFVAPALQWLVERDGQLVQLSPEKFHA